MDSDKLIQAVHGHSALWEIGSTEYMNANIKKKKLGRSRLSNVP